MKSFFKALILVPIALAIVLFSVANRASRARSPSIRSAAMRRSWPSICRSSPWCWRRSPLGVLIGGLASWLRRASIARRRAATAARSRRCASETQSLRSAVPDSALPALTNGRD